MRPPLCLALITLAIVLTGCPEAQRSAPPASKSATPGATATATATATAATPTEIRVLTDRTASHLQLLFDEYNKATGNKVVANFVDQGLLARLAARPNEADLVITKNAYLLELAKRRKLLRPFSSKTIEANVPAELRDPERHYTTLSYRARLIFYAKDRVKPEDLSTYADLADPKWKGKICLRSGVHEYNVSLFSQLAAADGLEATEKLVTGLADNLARTPEGNDRAQVRAIMEGKCDVALANSYYMGIMLGIADQKAWAESSRVFFPNQEGRGAIVMRSAAALTPSKERAAAAAKLLEFLTEDYAQTYFANRLLEYPVKEGVPMAPVNQELGKEQGIEKGVFKKDVVPLAKAADQREAVMKKLEQVDFDRKR